MFHKIKNSAKLISLPEIYLRLKELLEDPEYTMAEVVLLVGSDPGFATRFLRVVNSPLYRRINEIETIGHAVSLLGINQIHDIVLSVSFAKAFEGIPTNLMDMRHFWKCSFYCAAMAKQLALERSIKESDRLFTIGLLFDIGHLLMYTAIPEESQRVILKAKELEQPLYQVERDLLGFDYAEVGSYMMKQWNLPKSYYTTTKLHTEPSMANQFALETALLHLSVLLVRSDIEGGVFGEGAFAVDPSVWTTTNLTTETILAYRPIAAEHSDKIENSLFSNE